MGDFIPPTDGKVTKKASATAFVPPTDSVELKKKEELEPTSTPQKSVLGTPTGSSGGVNPAFKSSIPSPIPDFNSMESVKSVVQKPQVKLQKPPEKEETSFFDYLKENLDTGLATVSKSVYDAPGLIYDAAAAITNIPFKLAGVPENELASSDKLAKDLGFRNIPSEVLKEKIKISNDKINAYSAKNGGDALTALESGNYSGAAKLVAGTTMQSLPIMVAAMASGGQSTALTAIGVSTASTKNAQLKEENPEMELGTRVLNSANAGVIEAVTGHLFTGASGAVMKKILADKGVEAGSRIIGKSFRSTVEKAIEKNPLVGAIGEVVEESAVEFGNQVNDMSSGIRTEFDFHAIKNAGLSATGMGGLQTLGVYGAKGYVKAKDYAKLKSVNKEVFKLRSEIDNGNLSPENKAILSLRADRLEAENKKLLVTEIEKVKALPTEQKAELNALNSEFEDLKMKFDDIDDADDIPANLKPAMKEEIRIQAAKNQKRKTEILSQNDGLEVKDDFSKFEGVEPDFDLENGKISSLPLKEQNRLNKLAVEQITGGDKTIEYTKEQVSQTANEIYKNEQTPPTPEAQPQAEVPQQAEAEKVVEQAVINNDEIATKNNNKVNDVNALSNGSNQEVSPVEDVVATSSNEPIVYKVTALLPKKFNANSNNTLMTESELELLDAKAEKIIENPREDVSDRVRIQQGNAFTIQDLDAIEQFFKARREGIETRSFSDWRKNTTLEKNEATPETNTPTNGNVQLGASNVGESGNAEPKTPAKKSVPSSVDGGEVKGDASVGKIKPNIGDKVDFGEGEEVITGFAEIQGQTFIKSKPIEGNMVNRESLNPLSEYNDVLSKQEEYSKRAEENKKAQKEREIEAENKAKKQQEKQNEFEDIDGFANDKTAIQKGKILQHLNKQVYRGTIKSELRRIANLPHRFIERDGKKRVIYTEENGTEFLLSDVYTTKTGLEYLQYLVDKNAKTVETAQVENKQSETKPTTKEKIAERIKLSDAKIDEKSDAVKAKLKAFADMFPSADINPDDYKTNGFSTDAIIDMVAKAAKSLMEAGIRMDEAIKQAIEGYNTHFDDKIDPKEIEERINPKKEAEKDFKSKSGKKSLLGRLVEGGNPDVITKAVKELGENYDVRNQEEANEEAMAFIDKVGASEALKAIKDGLITNSDVKMLIYDEALTRLKTEISDEMDNNPEDREALIQKFQEVSDDFDKAIRDAGQGIAIMNYIYNKNQTLKYNLKKQIADWKRNDPNGEIPADIKAKFEELEKKLKDVEERTKDAEERAKKAEDELAIKNIQEDVERKNQAARKNKSGLTPQEQNRKKQLRDKFARANDVTGIPALLVDPEFREYLGLVLKTAKGDFSNFSNEILKELGKSARQHLPELFANAGGKGDVKVTDLQSITISEEGKIKIPAQLLRDYVEQGYTDIDEIAALIKDDIADEFPDADVRDIRDALTGYGKQINPNKDEITAQVNKLKEYGRLLSAYDDVMNGEMPKKSGLVRPKSEQKARELRRNVNRLAKELNLEPVDLESQWANAVDKVKSHLKNQIEDLDKQISNGEKRKVDRTPIKLDEEATALKTIRDAKKQILDDLVGKPELTEEQKIASAEKSLETSIKKIQEEIDTNDIAFKEKPTAVNSKKIEELKAAKKALLETKKQLRQEAGLIEQQRLKTTKTRIKNQIEDLNTRIKNRDFAKKEVKPILADSELNTLRAEKEAIYEEYEKMKYLQELKNRTFAKKLMDEGLEALGLARAIKASLDLGLIGIQLRGFTYSELWRNPKELAHKFIKMFGAIGSQNKTNKAMSELIGHPLHALAKKLDIGMTHPDLRNEVREEMASGNLLHFIWSSPVLAVEALGGKEAMNSKRASIGDSFIDSVKKQYNKLFQNYQVDIKQKEKFSVKEQWKNINAFEAVERGLSVYGNQLRFEEFVRGVDRLKAEGKDEINHLEDYKALASYIRTFSGRAKPAGFELNQKALNVFFFSFKNMASVIQQLNPIYYGIQHTRSTDFKNGNYFKPTVANKMAMATMFKSVVSTSATLLFVIAAYNAFKDDDEEEATIEKDPRSSDFGKLKIGNFRYDPWGGYIPLISLYARLATEEVKKSDGTISKFGEDRFGIQNRGDAASRFLINKESPGFQMFHKYMTSTEEVDKATGETYRATPFGGKLSEEDAYSFYPIFIGSVKSAKEKDYEGVQAFLTAYSILGLGNVQEYESKKGNTLEGKFIEKQEKIKEYNALPQEEKDKVDSNAKIPSLRGAITEQENMKYAIKTKTPYYVKGDSEPIDLSDITIAEIDETIADLKNSIEEMKKEAGDKYKEPKN